MKLHSTMGLLVTTSLAVGAANAATPESEDSLVIIPSETVRYDATDLNDQRAARQLFNRIRGAAEEVCRISSSPRGYEIWHEHDCAAQAVAEAVSEADNPALDEYVEKLRR